MEAFDRVANVSYVALADVSDFLARVDPSKCCLTVLHPFDQVNASVIADFLRNYRSLTAFGVATPEEGELESIFEALDGYTALRQLSFEDLDNLGIAGLCKLLPKLNLRDLSLENFDAQISEALLSTNITKFSLECCKLDSAAPLSAFFKSSPSLAEIDLERVDVPSEHDWPGVFGSVPSRITAFEFSLGNFSCGEHSVLADLLKRCRCLKTLTWRPQKVPQSPSSLISALQQSTSLRNLNVFVPVLTDELKRFIWNYTVFARWDFQHKGAFSGRVNFRNDCCVSRVNRLAVLLIALRKFRAHDQLMRLPRDLVTLIAKEIRHNIDPEIWWDMWEEKDRALSFKQPKSEKEGE